MGINIPISREKPALTLPMTGDTILPPIYIPMNSIVVATSVFDFSLRS